MSNNKKKKNSRPPPSREAEHKRINEIIQDVSKQIRKFHQKYFDNSQVDYVGCSECMDRLLDSWDMDKDSISTWKEFVELTTTNKTDKKIKLSDEFSTLLLLCERAKDFEIMIPEMRNKLVSCVSDHVYKYCRSFEEEAKPLEIVPIQNYESLISGSKPEIDSKIDIVNHSILRYGELKSPFYKFVFDGQEHGTIMEDISVHIGEICQLLRTWVKEDASYPENLYQDIQFNTTYRDKMQKDIVKLHNKRSSQAQQIEKLERITSKLEIDYDNHKREKMKTKRRVETNELKLERLRKEREKINEDLEKVKNQKSQKSPRSLRDRQNMNEQIENDERKLEQLDEREDIMTRQLNRLRRDFKKVSDRTYELKVEVVTNRHQQYDIKQQLLGIGLEIKSLQDRIRSIDEKMEVLKKIREMKLSPATLRKMHNEEKTREQPDETLEDACLFVADSIGNDWKQLYKRLPFEPKRDANKRQRDVEIMDLIAAKRDRTAEEQAQKSLEKWRTFHRKGEIPQLIKTLRKMHKVDVARKLENKYMIENVYS